MSNAVLCFASVFANSSNVSLFLNTVPMGLLVVEQLSEELDQKLGAAATPRVAITVLVVSVQALLELFYLF